MVIESGQSPLVFGHQLRFERGQPVARNVERHLAAGDEDGLGAGAVAMVAGLALRRFGMEMVSQLAGEHAFSQLFLELTGQAGFAENGLGVLVLNLGQQLIDQFIRKEFGGFRFLGLCSCAHWCGHGVSLSASSHDLRHTKILTGSTTQQRAGQSRRPPQFISTRHLYLDEKSISPLMNGPVSITFDLAMLVATDYCIAGVLLVSDLKHVDTRTRLLPANDLTVA